MKKKRIFGAVALVAAAVGLAAVAWGLLPDTVATQINLSGQVSSTMPKQLALGVPVGLTAVFSALYCIQEDGRKNLFVAILGIALLAITLFMNLR